MYRRKLTIATVCFNAVNEIEKTINSIIPFINNQIEYIVVDGKSEDGTLNLLRNYESKISLIISEKDEGIYDAMNKAVKNAAGDWIIFINCGDRLLSIPKEIMNDDYLSYDCILASVLTDNNRMIVPKVSIFMYIRNTIPHQGLFYNISRNKIDFDTQYKIFADHDLNLKLYKSGFKYYFVDKIVAYHALDGISTNKAKAAKESFFLRKNHGGWFLLIVSYLYFKVEGLIFRLKKLIYI